MEFTECTFVSAEGALAEQLQHLGFHVQTAHPQPQPQQQPVQQPQPQHHGNPRGKVDRPTLQPNSNREGWDFFRYDWDNYKTAMGISGATTSAHLYGCLDDELKKDLQRSNQGVTAGNMSEVDVMAAIKKLAAIKRLAVKEESKLAHRIKLGRTVQLPGTNIRTFYAQLEGFATACEYKVSSTCICNVQHLHLQRGVHC